MHILEMKLHCSSFFPQTNVLIICKDFLALDTPRATLKLWYITSHLWNRIRKQSVELLVGAVANPTPTRRVKVLPDASQANSHPLAEQGVGVWQLLQAVRYQIALQTGLLEGRGAMQNEWWVYEMQRCEGYKRGRTCRWVYLMNLRETDRTVGAETTSLNYSHLDPSWDAGLW